MTLYGFGRATTLRNLQVQKDYLNNCCDRGISQPVLDYIDFCLIKKNVWGEIIHPAICDSKSFKSLLEVLKKGDEVWCVSMKHLSKDCGERIKCVELINQKEATVIFWDDKMWCEPKSFELNKKWLLQYGEHKANRNKK
jgi:hypothetical protein